MDAARAAQGHGWPFAAGLRSDDVAREVWRSQTRMSGQAFCFLWGDCQRKSPGKAKQKPKAHTEIS
ncbi:hypothetical protein D3C78_1736020 [compost metagenome]